MWVLWPLMLGLGYYFLPMLGVWLWLRQIWRLRSGWLRGVALAVLILILVSSLNSQAIPSYNLYWMIGLGLPLLLPYFLPDEPKARPYYLATHAILLSMSLALHLWYAYLAQRLQFDNSLAYYALPCLCICVALSLLIMPQVKTVWARLGLLAMALALGISMGQIFLMNA